jgi:hypothetical protein
MLTLSSQFEVEDHIQSHHCRTKRNLKNNRVKERTIICGSMLMKMMQSEVSAVTTVSKLNANSKYIGVKVVASSDLF